MVKKILAFIIMVGMISNTGIAYGATTEDRVIGDSGIVGSQIKDSLENEHQGVPDEAEESLEGMEDTQEVEDKEVVPEGSQGVIEEPKDSGSVEDKEQQEQQAQEKDTPIFTTELIEVTTGSGTFDGDTFEVNNYNSFDFTGSFEINPSAGELKGTPVTLRNEGETKFILTAETCRRLDNNSPAVVKPDAFADWTTISTEETTGNIAFGFLVKNEAGEEVATFWFEDEDSQVAEAVYTVAPGETVTVEIIGKHGLSWEKACTLSYDCKVGIEVIPLEIVVEQPLEVVPPVEPEVIPAEPEVPVVPDVIPDEAEEAPEEPELTPDESEEGTPTEDEAVEEGSTDNEQADLEDTESDSTEDGSIQEDVAELPNDAIVPTAPEDNVEQGQEPQEDTVPADESKQVDSL